MMREAVVAELRIYRRILRVCGAIWDEIEARVLTES